MQVLKNDRLKEREKKKETELLLGNVADERFALLVNLGKKITDFGSEEKVKDAPDEGNIDETYGINVQFEESEEESDEDVYGEVREEDDVEEEGEESKIDSAIRAENVSYWQEIQDLLVVALVGSC